MLRKRKLLALLASVTLMTSGMMAYAVEPTEGVQSDSQISSVNLQNEFEEVFGTIGTPENPDILVETFARGTSAPSKVYNSNLGSYSFEGTYKVALYTNYAFYPNSNGKLTISATTTWPAQYTNQRGCSVELRKKGGKVVGSASAYTTKQSNGSYSRSATISKTFSGLDTSATYYFYLTKATDSVSASLSGKVKF